MDNLCKRFLGASQSQGMLDTATAGESVMLPENEPDQKTIEAFLTSEERALLAGEDVPDEVKAEILDRLKSFETADQANAGAEDTAK